VLEVATRSWRIRKVYEQDRVDVLGSGCLIESGAISVDMEERISGRKRTKGCLHYWLDIGRIQDDESVDGHLTQASQSQSSAVGAWSGWLRSSLFRSLCFPTTAHSLATRVAPCSLI
jgi:hypothetical protein